jgi:hypothetical protein
MDVTHPGNRIPLRLTPCVELRESSLIAHQGQTDPIAIERHGSSDVSEHQDHTPGSGTQAFSNGLSRAELELQPHLIVEGARPTIAIASKPAGDNGEFEPPAIQTQ